MSRSLPPFSQPNFRHLMVDVSQRSALLAALEQIEPLRPSFTPRVQWRPPPPGNLDPQRSESLWRLHVDAAPDIGQSLRPDHGAGREDRSAGKPYVTRRRWSLAVCGHQSRAGRSRQELGGRAGACRGDGQRRGSWGNRYADASSARQRKFPAAASAAWATHYPQEVVSGELVAERGRIGDDRTGAGDVGGASLG